MSDKARLPYVGVDDASEAPEPLPRRRPAPGPLPGNAGGLPAWVPPPDLAPQPVPPAGSANGQANGLLPRRPAADSLREPAVGQLPRRPPRVLPVGRHRSPHRLTLPADAPPLVLAVGGVACAASDDITAQIVSAVQSSCPGAIIRVEVIGKLRRPYAGEPKVGDFPP